MPTFVHPALLWGTLLVGVPVLIHLINMLRHRRVEWAAMEFLLQSQRKNRTWIIFKQLLLLLMRMLAVAVIVLILAQPQLRNRLGLWFGGTKTHHVVLADDSFSMAERWAGTSAFAEAKAVIQRIGVEAARQVQPQTFTLLRFSRAGRTGRGTQPDLWEEPVTTDFGDRLKERLSSVEVSQTAATPLTVLEAVDRLLEDSSGEQRIVYLVSDFRLRQWDDPADVKKHLLRLNEAGSQIHLINCSEKEQSNLAIAGLSPTEGTRAAGTPWFMEVTVQNFGAAPARDVPVLLEEDGHGRPAVVIAEVPPGRAVKERFSVQFPTSGMHQITARLESDPVEVDNFRYEVTELPDSVPVLMVDGDPSAGDGRYLSAALAPGGPVRTGVQPRIEPPRALSTAALDAFHTIYLLNIDHLDKSAITALEKYVSDGGNLGVFLGPRSHGKFVNDQLYRGGEGLFPVPLADPTELLIDHLQKAPDLEVDDHPIFRVLAGKRNSFIATVLVERYFRVPDGWKPKEDSTTRVIARLRNGAPLAVERNFGRGRVVALLTSAAPVWNNWARNPSFVVAMQDLQAYLSRRPAEVSRQVGSPLELKLDASRYQPQVRFVTPTESTTPTGTIDAVPAAGGLLTATLTDTDTSGIYEARLVRTDGKPELRRWAINVDASEGDLKAVSSEHLASRLHGVVYDFEQASAFRYSAGDLAGYNLSEALLYFLGLLLIAEQILAWSASYHPPARQAALPAGGAA